MDPHRFLSELPDRFRHWQTLQVEAIEKPLHSDPWDPGDVNLLQVLRCAAQNLQPGEQYCQIGADPKELTALVLKDVPTVQAVVLPLLGGSISAADSSPIDPTEQKAVTQINHPEQASELILTQWSQRFGSDRIGLCFLPQFTDYRTHLLSLRHCQPWLADRALLITTGAKWSALKQANLDFLATHPQAQISLSLGILAASDTSFGDGLQILVWETESAPETNAQHWQIYHRISQTLISRASPTHIHFRSPQSTHFPGQILCLEGILSPKENSEIYTTAVQQQENFLLTGFYQDHGDLNLAAEDNYRQSLKLDLESFSTVGEWIRQRVLSVLPQILPQFGLDQVEVTGTEMELVAHNHQHHYSIHYDNATPETQTRVLSYLYYFCRDPKPFWGGQLRVYDTERDPQTEHRWIQGYFNEFIPENNCLVFFPSSCIHEVLPVICPSHRFEESRFTINGWIRG